MGARLQQPAWLVLLFAISCSKAQAACLIVPSPGGSAYAPIIEAAAGTKVTLPSWEAPMQPPISLLGLADLSTWSPSSFQFGDTVGASWTATVASTANAVQLLLGDAALCTLSKVEVVSWGREEPYFQMQFAECENSDPIVLEIPVRKATAEHAVTGITLVAWMSFISPSLFAHVVTTTNAEDPSMVEFVEQMKFAAVGDGHCTSENGGLTHEVAIVTSQSDCAFQCALEIRAAVIMSRGGGGSENLKYCKGYSWKTSGSTCELYYDWDIDGTDGDSSAGSCYKPGADSDEVGTIIDNIYDEASLNWETLLGGEAATLLSARTLSVSPKESTCFKKFNLYTLSEGIYISTTDWDALNSTFGSIQDQYRSQPPGTDMTVVMDRACVRDMAGTLRGACADDESKNYEGVYKCVVDGGELTSCETYNHTAQGLGVETGIVQECTSCFLFWLVLVALGLLLLLLAFCCTSLCIKVLCPKRVVEGPEKLEFTEVLVEADRSYYDRFRDAFSTSA